MDTTVVLVALIIGFSAITVFSLMALLFVRRRERERDTSEAQRVGKTVEELDAALNAALAEINKLGALVQKEVDEKYKSVLFLYDLVEDKQKEISEATGTAAISAAVARCVEEQSAKLREVARAVALNSVAEEKPRDSEPPSPPEPPTESLKILQPRKRPTFSNSKHEQIWEMRENGQNVSQIAKELSMGQGEVKLILDLVDRAS